MNVSITKPAARHSATILDVCATGMPSQLWQKASMGPDGLYSFFRFRLLVPTPFAPVARPRTAARRHATTRPPIMPGDLESRYMPCGEASLVTNREQAGSWILDTWIASQNLLRRQHRFVYRRLACGVDVTLPFLALLHERDHRRSSTVSPPLHSRRARAAPHCRKPRRSGNLIRPRIVAAHGLLLTRWRSPSPPMVHGHLKIGV